MFLVALLLLWASNVSGTQYLATKVIPLLRAETPPPYGLRDKLTHYLGTLSLAQESALAPEEASGHERADDEEGTKKPKMSSDSVKVGQAAPKNADKRAQMAFRPVSMTLYVTMVLTIACLAVYTLLAFFRNRDELSGMMEPSLATEALQASSRSTAYCPMLCMTCVACRMYVLSVTEGFGEPPNWVKACMAGAAVGCILQFFVVLFLPLTTDTSESEQTFAEATGDQYDLHPHLHTQTFAAAPLRICAFMNQMTCIVLIYGGVGGIIAGTFMVSEAGGKPISPSLYCTLLLSALYFSIALLSWLSRALRMKTMEQAFVSASLVSRKAPMIAILFLAARMRAINLDPPDGLPPPWARVAFMVTTAALFAETLGAMLVGALGTEDTGYYGTKSYNAPRAAHLCQHLFALVALGGVGVTFWSIILLENKETGKPAPLAPAVKCVLQLNALYFFVMGMLTLLALLKDVCKKAMPMMLDVFNSACIALSISPLLCVLFVATRMRALQITQQKGSPPGWAQDCFFMCTFATTIQVVCCLALPMFTGMAKVDGDGNAQLDMQPMIGAYLITVVKFVALMALHGGVVVICIAVFVMTPETAKPGESAFKDSRAIFKLVFTGSIIFMVAMLLSSAKVIGLAIKFAIESVDQTFLGVDIHVKAASLGICRGLVFVNGIIIENPEGFQAPYMLKLDVLLIKLNIGRLVWSLGKEFEITHLEVKGIQIIFEKDFIANSKSNVQQIIDNLEEATGIDIDGSDTPAPAALPPPPPPPPPPAKEEEKKEPVSMSKYFGDLKAKAKKQHEEMQETLNMVPEVIVYKVDIRDIGVNIYNGADMAATAQIGTIDYPNFYEHCGGNKAGMGQKGATVICALIKIVLGTVLKNRTILLQLGNLSRQILAAKAGNLAKNVKNKVVRLLKSKDVETEEEVFFGWTRSRVRRIIRRGPSGPQQPETDEQQFTNTQQSESSQLAAKSEAPEKDAEPEQNATPGQPSQQ